MGPQLDRRHRTLLRDHVGGELGLPTCGLAGNHNRRPDRGVTGEHRLDLAQLDPVAADLDLMVETAQILGRRRGGRPRSPVR